MLTRIEQNIARTSDNRPIDLFRCHCGNNVKRRSDAYIEGSCGCSRGKHRMYKTRIYKIWLAMRYRCEKEGHAEYKNYGGRGIHVCHDWQSFEKFREWAFSNGYRDDLTIDRIDNDDGYSPDNCRWATQTIQLRNRRGVKINLQIASLIKKLRVAGMSGVEVAKLWGISSGTVSVVLNGRNWRDPL